MGGTYNYHGKNVTRRVKLKRRRKITERRVEEMELKYWPVVSILEHGDELTCSIKDGEFIDQKADR
jgi:hypothetical protein